MIRFSPGPGGSFAVEVDSPAGEGHGSFRIPEDLQAPQDHESALPGDGKSREAVPRRRKAELSERDAGSELFRALFQGQVSKLFQRSLGRVSGEDGGLRVLIELDPQQKELAPIQELPWERLCDPDARDFLALSRKTPIARTLRVPQERRPAISQAAPLHILAAAASPSCCPPLDLERELNNLEKGWKEIVVLRNTNWEKLRQAFIGSSFDVFHFLGHGGFDRATGEGTLMLEGEGGAADPVEGSVLAQELKDFSSLRLIVLNACHTARSVGEEGPNPFAGTATALMMAGVPAVIAMSRPISDAAAVAFSRSLYESLAAGKPVETALAEARLAVGRLGEWATPVLFLRTSKKPVLTVVHVSFLAATAVLAVVSLSLGLRWGLDFRALVALRSNNQGISLLEEGQTEEARQELNKALKIDSDNAVVHANLSVLEEGQGNYEEALAHARAAIKAEPDEAIHHYNLGTLLIRRGSQDEALCNLGEAVRLRPDYAEARNKIGSLYLALDRPAEARKEFEAGLEVNPDLAPLHKNLARVALVEGRIDEAIRELKVALSLYGPEDRQEIAEVLYWLATAHAQAGDPQEACARLKEIRYEAGAGQWVSKADALSRQILCLEQPEEGDSSRHETGISLPDGDVPRGLGPGTDLTAVVSQIEGNVTVREEAPSRRRSDSGPIRLARFLQVVRGGDEIRVSASAKAGLICSNDRIIVLSEGTEHKLTEEVCLRGKLLRPGTYKKLAPLGGRMSSIEGANVLERKTRSREAVDAGAPILLSPRNTALLEVRPKIVWIPVPGATEYEINIVGSFTFRFPLDLNASELQCTRSGEPGGLFNRELWGEPAVCSIPWPASAPDLYSGETFFLSVGARLGLGAPLRAESEPSRIRILTEERAKEVRSSLQTLGDFLLEREAFQLLVADIYAQAGVFSEAISAYQHAFSKTPESRITLGDSYLAIGLLSHADRSYREALENSPEPAAQAAAEFGLGRVEYSRGSFDQALEHLRKAWKLYEGEKLAKESAAARSAEMEVEKMRRRGGGS